jgi:hypothetical protein
MVMEKRLHFTFFDKSVFIKSVIIVCFLSFFSAKAFSQATVSTDQPDYPPGSTVYITGSGFAANETVTLQVLHVGGGDDLTSPAHQPWTVTADASGNISSTWLVPLDQDELGATLQLTATGQTSGLIAQVTFTDNSAPNLAYPATNIFVVGKSVTLTPTNVGGGQPNSTTTSSPLPTGLSISKAGVISGIPTAVSSNTLYTVITSNNVGPQTPSPTLSIQVVLPPIISYNTPNTFVVGTPVSLSPSNTGSVSDTYSVSPALPGGLSLNTSTGVISGTPTNVTASGSYTVTATNLASGGTGTFAISITVNPALPSITYPTPDTYVYGTTITSLTPTSSGGAVASYSVSPTLPAGLSLAVSTGIISGKPTAATAAADYTVTATNATGPSTFVIHITVNPRPLNVTASGGNKVYDGTTAASVNLSDDRLSGDKITLTSTANFLDKNVGQNKTVNVTNIAITGGTDAANYTLVSTITTSTANISLRPLSITANNANKYFGTTLSTVTGSTDFTSSGLQNGETIGSVTIAYNAGSAATDPVGTYTGSIVPSAPVAAPLSAFLVGNYSITYTAGTLTVLPPLLPAPVITYNTPNTFVYGTAITTLTPTNTGGAVASYSIDKTLPSGLSFDTGTGAISGTPTTISAATNYIITAHNTTGDGHFTLSIEIDKASLTITAKAQSKVYGSAQNLGTSAFTASALYNGDSISGVTLASDGSVATATVGTYDITPSAATGSGLSNYSISYVNGKDTVKAAALTITAKNQSKIYGTSQTLGTIAFTSGTLYNGDSVAGVTLASDGSVVTATVGTYDITPSAATGSGLSNYSISYVNGKDTVKAAALTITAKNQSKIYGTSQTLGTIAFTSGTLYNGDSVAGVTLASDGSVATATVGTYDIMPSAATGSGLSNYSISYVNGKDTVKAAPLTITAKNQSKIYGTAQTLGTTAFTPGTLYNGDSVTGVTLTSNGSPASAIVGTYDIVPSLATGSGLSNYSISYINGKDTVKVAPLTITAKNQSKVYGTAQTLGTTAVTALTLYNSDSVTGVTLSSDGSAASAVVGVYDIVPSTAIGSGLSNYSISYVNGKDTVNKAQLTITAKDTSKVYGATITFAGTEFTPSTLYNGDQVTSVTLTSAGTGALASVTNTPYNIIITPGSAQGTGLSNYNITYKSGNLTVTPYVDCGAFVYNGITFTNTDIGQTYGTVNLSLVITSSNGGDARTAAVKFYNVTSGSPAPIGTAAVSTSSTSSQATYSLSIQVPLNGSLSVTNTIGWDVSGNFSNKTCSDSTTDVTVSSRTSDFLTGGGYVVLNPTTNATKSFGKYAGAAGTKTNFGFNVKWNKSLTNIQGGGFTAIIRTPTMTYQLKAVKVTTLGVTPANGPTPAMATFTSGNATLTSVDPVTGVITTYASNANLTIDVADVCEPGGGSNVSSDLIGITLKDGKTGQLLYSNNWDGTKTIKQALSGGNLQIHNDANTPAPLCSSALNTVASLKNDMPRSTTSIAPSDLIKDPGINPLSVTVYPNPSPNSFNISMKGGSDEKVDVTVSDVLGHLMKRYRVAPGTSIALGDDFGVGIYIVQVRQGQTFKYYRIYKAPN